MNNDQMTNWVLGNWSLIGHSGLVIRHFRGGSGCGSGGVCYILRVTE